MYRIVYERHWSGCYHVNWIQKNITICVTQGFMKKLLNVDHKVLLGCCYVNQTEIIALGFIDNLDYPQYQENEYGRIS